MSEMKWIKCSERLPGTRECVAFVYADDRIMQDGRIWLDRVSKVWMENHRMDYFGAYKGTVTHWMPFPEAPVEQNE